MRTNLQFSQRLVDALVILHPSRDRRTIARYFVNLVNEILPQADLVAFYVYFQRQRAFGTIGVSGYPHFSSTLITEEDSPFGQVLSSRQQVWARTPTEVAQLYQFPDDGSLAYERTHLLYEKARVATCGSAIVQPCLIGDEFFGALWVETTSSPRAFSVSDRSRLAQLGVVAAVLLSRAPTATVYDAEGLPRKWEVASIPEPATGTLPQVDPRLAGIFPASSANSLAAPAVPNSPVNAFVPPEPEPRPPVPLSDRELAVLKHIAGGATNAEIATELFISVNTVRSHRRNLMRKLDSHNAVELLTAARYYGLITAHAD
ncbi:two-component response regulator [Actinobaculum suis]|uniref:Two-component response regulator n=1 Tax=Actinobaculum suis TaxID=1657 RepID=A0A7Z8Y8C3_9ACTO|nr:two-component response regulator [Actinobaculum suis]